MSQILVLFPPVGDIVSGDFNAKAFQCVVCFYSVYCAVFRHMALGLALKFVLEALKQEAGSKMYMFGIAALDRFKLRLKDCGQYCQHIVTIPHFSQFPKLLLEVR